MAAGGVVLEVDGVSKSFGALSALSRVGLAVSEGEVFSIIVGLVLVLIVLFAPRGLLGFRQALRGRPAAKASR